MAEPTPEPLLRTRPLPPQLLESVWRNVGFIPHALQRQVLMSRARNGVFAAGRRAGKSRTGGMKLVPEAFRALGEMDRLKELNLRREFWIVGPEYSDAEKEFRVVWDSLKSLGFEFDRPGSYNNPESGEMHISMFDRRFIIAAKSAKYPGTLVGEGLSGVLFSEAAKLKPSVWNKFIRPTLADFGGWSFFSSTPEGRNWFYDFWQTGQDPWRTDWESWRAPSWSNPYVYPGGVDETLLRQLRAAGREDRVKDFLAEIQMVQTDMGLVPVGIDPEIFSLFLDQSAEMFGQEIGADFTEFSGRVFKDWDEEVHVGDFEYNPGWVTYACADYGFTNPFVWLIVQIDPHGERMRVVDEYYETERTTEEAANEIRSRGLARNAGSFRIQRFFPDPAEPDRTRELQNRLGIRAGGGQSPRRDRIEWIRRKLKAGPAHLPLGHAERKPYLMVNRRCKNFIREMNIWRYPDLAKAYDRGRAAPEEPEPRNNHCPEALGRLMSGVFGSPWKTRGAGKAKARVGR